MIVHQFVPTWEAGAIGSHILGLHELMTSLGITTRLWASDIRSTMAPIAHDAAEFFATPANDDNVLLYHLAVGAEMGEQLLGRPEPLVVNHHNVTPPHYFDSWMPALAENLEVGESQVLMLAQRACLGIGDSKFNASAFERAGCNNTVVAPVFVDVLRLGAPIPMPTACAPRASDTRWLFVGRVAPNKAIHDLVTAFAWYRSGCDTTATLTIVGGVPADGSASAVQRLVTRLGLEAAVEFVGAVTDHELADCYRRADVYVSCSEHEGFGVPLVEAMHMGVPVIALDAAAVGETVGNSAVLVQRRDPALFACAAARVCSNAAVRHGLVTSGRERSRQFSQTAVSERWTEIIGTEVLRAIHA